MTSCPEDEEVPDPPHPDRVARRALLLAALVCRSSIDHGAGNPEAESLQEQLQEWIAALPFGDELSPRVERLLTTPLGSLAERERIAGSWEVEGLAVLTWALGWSAWPPHGEQVDPYAVTDDAGLLDPAAVRRIAAATLRPAAEIEACRELHYALHCRARDLLRAPERPDRNPFQTWLEPEWLCRLGIDERALVVDDEVALDALPATRVSRERLRELEEIVRERHRASIWLAGEQPDYERITTDT